MDRTIAHSALQRLVRDYLEVNGAWVLNVAGGPLQRPGIPDLLACLAGRMIAIEVKTGPAGRLAPNQHEELCRLREAGAVAFMARSIEAVEDILLTEKIPIRHRLEHRP